LALSKDKEGLLALAKKGQQLATPVDLVFYNYILKCFVLIDLKIGKLAHQDLGQMQMYVNYYRREMMALDDNPPIGIYLPTEEELKTEKLKALI